YYTEARIVSGDGHTLFVRRWLPADVPILAHALVLHGYMEHSGRYRELAHHFAHAGIASTAIDFRGHGRSDGQRGYVARFADYLSDVDAALHGVGEGPRFLVGHSNGALIALDYVMSRRPTLAGLVVTNPFLGQTHPSTGLKLWVGRMAGKRLPRLSLPSGLSADGLSHEKAVVEAYRRDPWVFNTANAAWFRETSAAQTRLLATAREIDVQLLYAYSDADPIASPTLNERLSAQLVSKDKTVVVRPGELHEILNETERASLHQQISDWIRSRAAGAQASAP
ncbi:MAG TPA: alpha/beta hydrolase, partial [Myxococcota bacterium]|nr:alpha/beta hydrolase [Myxococcota bacterium]